MINKAISLRQPWAWLVASGHKPIEFRNRGSSFRGECYIHAAKTIDKKAFPWIANNIPIDVIRAFMVNGLPDPGMFITGKIIGKARVVDCLTIDQALEVRPQDVWLLAARGSLGKRAFLIESPVYFPPEAHVPCRGKVFPLFYDPGVEVDA